MAYWGMDVSAYPGDTKMQAWKSNSTLKWTGFYLAPTSYHSDTSWMGKRSTIINQGWNIVPIYVGLQEGDSGLSAARGLADAHAAETLAKNAGFSSGTYIYLDIEQGGLVSDNFINYIKGFVTELAANTIYEPAIYCSYSSTADQIKAAVSISLRYWVFHIGNWSGTPVTDSAPTTSNGGVSYAHSWQLIQNTSKTIGGYTISPVDFSSSTTTSPAN